MVPRDVAISYFLGSIKSKNIKNFSQNKTVILFINGLMPKSTDTIGRLYDRYKNPDDNILYMDITTESVFG
jgi:hypothetical protein